MPKAWVTFLGLFYLGGLLLFVCRIGSPFITLLNATLKSGSWQSQNFWATHPIWTRVSLMSKVYLFLWKSGETYTFEHWIGWDEYAPGYLITDVHETFFKGVGLIVPQPTSWILKFKALQYSSMTLAYYLANAILSKFLVNWVTIDEGIPF